MITRLRKKFIAVSMCSIGLVLIVIMGAIIIGSYLNVNQHAEELISILIENNGKFPKPDKSQKKEHEGRRQGIGPETPFETRYFSVLLSATGKAVTVDTGAIAAVSSTEAIAVAEEIYAKNTASGFVGNYKYALVQEKPGARVLFVDCSKDFATLRSFGLTCLWVSAAGLLAVFMLVWFFSKIALRPIAEGYRKQKQFITDASHEIKTPLTIIDANTELLELEGGENQWTESTRNQIQRLTNLTNNLVALARLDEESHVLQTTDFSLSDAVTEIATPFEALAVAQKKIFTTKIEQNLTLCGNEESIRSMLSILLENALKYTNANGEIKISAQKNGKKKLLQVSNTVDEIEVGPLDCLFERFYRRDASRSSATGGYGIGLSIAKATAEAHRGRITATSEDGHTLLITVTL